MIFDYIIVVLIRISVNNLSTVIMIHIIADQSVCTLRNNMFKCYSLAHTGLCGTPQHRLGHELLREVEAYDLAQVVIGAISWLYKLVISASLVGRHTRIIDNHRRRTTFIFYQSLPE